MIRYLFLLCFFVNLFTSQALAVEDSKKFDSIALEIEINAISHAEKVKLLLFDLQNIPSLHSNISYAVKILYLEARINFLQGINDSAFMSKVLTFNKTAHFTNKPFEEALLNHTLSTCYLINENYTEAFSLALKSLEQFQSIKNKSFIFKTLNLLGNICWKTQSGKMAIDYYQRAQTFTSSGSMEYYSNQIMLFTSIAYMEGESTTMIDSLKMLILKIEKSKDSGLLVIIYFNLGSILYNMGDIHNGQVYYQKCKELATKCNYDNKSFSYGLFCNLGHIYVYDHNYSKALQYSYAAKTIAESSRNLFQQSHVLYQISDIYNRMGNIDSAYFYLVKHNELKDILIKNSKTTEAYRAYISVFLESTKKELTIAEQKIIIKQKQFVFFIVLAIGTIFIIILLIIILQQKKRAMKKHIEKDRQIQSLQEDKIEMQVREITSYSLLLSNKNQTLLQISELIQLLLMPNTKNDIEIKHKIADTIKDNLNTDNDRNNFALHFDKVHPRFFENLKSHCNSLTENNLRLCAYFRIGMSAKQIAQILNISPDNVRISRYRLKKKLGLSEKDSFYDFLRNI